MLSYIKFECIIVYKVYFLARLYERTDSYCCHFGGGMGVDVTL